MIKSKLACVSLFSSGYNHNFSELVYPESISFISFKESPDKECCRQIFLKPPKQQLKIGGYYQFYRMYNGRPAYKLSGSRENWYLFYIQGSQNSVGRWVVYPQMMLNSSWKKFDISAEGNQKCPNEVGKQWISFWTWNGQSKLVDPNVDVICANSKFYS